MPWRPRAPHWISAFLRERTPGIPGILRDPVAAG
jgi:hypothetical protein